MPSQNDVSCSAEENPAVFNFREYLRIKTVQPEPDYDGAVKFLKAYSEELGLEYKCIEVHPGKPVVIMKWPGRDPSLKSVLLNSHMDVVPVFPEHWRYDAFEAVKDEKGDIYARGTQDMKSVGIQYLEAIRKLKAQGKKFLRNIWLTFVPDEEIGGKLGMDKFLKTEEFKSINLGFGLDEGLANPSDAYTVFYGERAAWWTTVKVTGNPGHGSRFIENTAAEKLRKVINSFLAFRAEQQKKLDASNCLTLGDVTTVNLTMVNGGVQHNVVPTEFDAVFDIRIAPTVNLPEFEQQLRAWCEEAGEGVTLDFIQQGMDQTLTPITKDDPWWKAFSGACESLGTKLETEVFPAATDSRFLRANGYPAIGFSPMRNTPILLHDHNEFLNEKVFLEGIDVYCRIIPALAEVASF